VTRRLFALLLVPSLALAAPVPKSLVKKADPTSLVGAWVTRPGVGIQAWVFRDDGTAGVGAPDNPTLQAIYKVDATQSPKHLDWSQDGGKTWNLGVYEVDGDVLNINFASNGGGHRPTTLRPDAAFLWVSGTRHNAQK